MRTIKEIQEEIAELKKPYDTEQDKAFKQSRKTRDGKRLQFLKTVLRFLENEPPQDYLIKEIETIKVRLDSINKGFGLWRHSTPGAEALKNPLQAYRTEMGYSTLNLRLQTLNYLLKQ